MMPPELVQVLRERRNYLVGRIAAKKNVDWDTEWDEREHEALSAAIIELEKGR